MPEVSKITLPSGTTYDFKDATARMALSGAMHWIGITTTEISDGSTVHEILVDGETVTVGTEDSGAVVGYAEKEYIWNGTKWQEFGSTGSLKALAFKDNARGSYTPEGNCSGTAVQLATTTVNSINAVGSLPSLTLTVSNETLNVAFNPGALPEKSGDTTVATGVVTSVTDPVFNGRPSTIEVS